MKVILLKDIKNLGKKWEVKHVLDGYARNFLLPKGVIKPATKTALKELDTILKQQELKATAELENTEATANLLDGYELTIKQKASDSGSLYAAITKEVIVDSLREAGFKISKSFIKLGESIKEVGEYPVSLILDHGLEIEIKVIVIAENFKA